jgi:hypothetical protein
MKQLSLYLIIIFLTLLLYSLPIAATIPSLSLFHLLILTIVAITLFILIVLLLFFYLTTTMLSGWRSPSPPLHEWR